jgi:hypothetical protein
LSPTVSLSLKLLCLAHAYTVTTVPCQLERIRFFQIGLLSSQGDYPEPMFPKPFFFANAWLK